MQLGIKEYEQATTLFHYKHFILPHFMLFTLINTFLKSKFYKQLEDTDAAALWTILRVVKISSGSL